MGGREPARLRRVPARMVAQLAALRDHAGAPRAARTAHELGSGSAQLQLALPRAAVRCRDGGASGRAGSRPACIAARPDSGAGRGCAAVRGRDGADAARPRAARAGGSGLPTGRRDRLARGAGDAARADCREARRPGCGRAAGAAGRGGARQDVHEGRARRARRAPKRSSSRCSHRSCAKRCSACRPIRVRPSAASTASSRTWSGMSPTRRLRSATGGRSTWLRPST